MIFIDTGAWLALADVRYGNHDVAVEAYDTLIRGRMGKLVTSDYVLDETLTLMQWRTALPAVRKFVDALQSSRSVYQVWSTPAQQQAALELFFARYPQGWNLTDCTSFVVMRELGIRTAFTVDSDFREAGFEVQPAPRPPRPTRKAAR